MSSTVSSYCENYQWRVINDPNIGDNKVLTSNNDSTDQTVKYKRWKLVFSH